MSKVAVTLNGREFSIGCEEGQEAYLTELAGYLDEKVTGIAQQVGQIGDLRLLLMASLVVVDELKEAQRQTGEMRHSLDALDAVKAEALRLRAQERQALAEQIAGAAERLEKLANVLDSAESEVGPASGTDGDGFFAGTGG